MYEDSEGPDQHVQRPVLLHSLIRAASFQLQKLSILKNVLIDNKDSDETVQMCRMI